MGRQVSGGGLQSSGKDEAGRPFFSAMGRGAFLGRAGPPLEGRPPLVVRDTGGLGLGLGITSAEVIQRG